MYGISAARPSSRAAAKAAAIRAPAMPHQPSSSPRPLDDLGQVLVAPAAESVRTSIAARRSERGGVPFKQPGDRVRGLERRDDPLEPGELAEGAQRVVVGDRHVAGPAAVAQLGVLGADARVVEAGGDRVRLEDLAVVVGEHRRERAVEDAGAPGDERGAVAAAVEPLAAGLDADQLDRLVVEERGRRCRSRSSRRRRRRSRAPAARPRRRAPARAPRRRSPAGGRGRAPGTAPARPPSR